MKFQIPKINFRSKGFWLFVAFVILGIAFAIMSGCTKKQGDTAEPAPVEHAMKKPSWAGGPGGQNGNPNNPPPNYVKIDTVVDFNLQWDTLTCGHLHITWSAPSNHPNLQQFLKHGDLPNSCSGPKVTGGNVLLNYLSMCGFTYGSVIYPDAYMWAFYRSNDTTYTFTSPMQSITTGEWPYWYDTGAGNYVCGPI